MQWQLATGGKYRVSRDKSGLVQGVTKCMKADAEKSHWNVIQCGCFITICPKGSHGALKVLCTSIEELYE